jgi:hypothetical protein
MSEIARATPFIAVPLHARAVQWDGSHQMAEGITAELNVLGLEFGFRLTRAVYEASLYGEPTFEWNISLSDGISFEGRLERGAWLALFVRHHKAVSVFQVDEAEGADLFAERHETIVVGVDPAGPSAPAFSAVESGQFRLL